MAIAWRRYGAHARAMHGVSFARQMADLLYLTWRLNQPAHDYYLQKMWLRPDRRTWSQYLQQREHVALVKWLGRSMPLAEFDNKLELFHRLRAACVPTIEVLRVASAGRWLPGYAMAAGADALRCSLVVKPTDGTMYDGVEIWKFDPAARTYTRHRRQKVGGRDQDLGDETCALEEVLDRTLTRSLDRTYVVQPMVRNDPALDPISPHHVANFRVVTAVRGGRPSVIAAILRMGYDTLRWVPSTYLATIDLETGVLGKATGREPEFGYGDTHIETGRQVAGLRLEMWQEVKALALRGHVLFPWMPLIGWDVVCPAAGPLIMEANACWGCEISQLDAPFLGEIGYAEAFWEAYTRGSASVRTNEPRRGLAFQTAGQC